MTCVPRVKCLTLGRYVYTVVVVVMAQNALMSVNDVHKLFPSFGLTICLFLTFFYVESGIGVCVLIEWVGVELYILGIVNIRKDVCQVEIKQERG